MEDGKVCLISGAAASIAMPAEAIVATSAHAIDQPQAVDASQIFIRSAAQV